MKNIKNDHTTHNFLKENAFYPRHVSDRADELIEELDSEQVLQLYDALKTKTYADWSLWLGDARDAISKYDNLSHAERKRRLKKPPVIETLLLHHACIYVELWRSRIDREYFSLPPSGPSIETPEEQREMMLNIIAAYDNFDPRDLWPFSHPSIDDIFPFKQDS